MHFPRKFFERKNLMTSLFQVVIILGNLTTMAVLFVYGYIGIFSRYLADDYCHSSSIMTSSNIFDAIVRNYMGWSDRYSNLLFVQLTDLFGKWGIPFMPAVTLILWVIGLSWLLSEIAKTIEMRWNWAITLFISSLAVFLSIFQAPNDYQILYWRAGLVTYLVPLVLFVYLAAFILWQHRLPFWRAHRLWVGLICFSLTFLAGGSSETTSALQIGILSVAVLAVWLQRAQNRRSDLLIPLGVSLVSAVLSILVMALAPGNSVRLSTHSHRFDLIELGAKSVIFTAQFIWDTLRTLPFPNAISIAIPLLVIYVQFFHNEQKLSKIPSSRIWLAVPLLPVIVFIVTVFSFAPSAYAQSYPEERVRFPARFLMTLALMAEGGFLGILASRIQLFRKAGYANTAAIIALGLLVLYPLRVAFTVYANVPEYSQRATAWDARQRQILSEKALGKQDIVVPQLPGIAYLKELDTSPNYWVNRCAATFYGVDSISAPQYTP